MKRTMIILCLLILAAGLCGCTADDRVWPGDVTTRPDRTGPAGSTDMDTSSPSATASGGESEDSSMIETKDTATSHATQDSGSSTGQTTGTASTSKPETTGQTTAYPTPRPTAAPSIRPTQGTDPALTGDYRQAMRDFVISISTYARSRKARFAVVPQNGEDIVKTGQTIHTDYLQAIDGIGREDFLYGYHSDNTATPDQIRKDVQAYLAVFQQAGKQILITDYCSTPAKVMDAYQTNQQYGYLAFAADERELNSIPVYPDPIFQANSRPIGSLADAGNFLYLINPEQYAGKSSFIAALAAVDYDLLIIDLFVNDTALTAADLSRLKQKSNGAARQVLCYMSIGEAEDYRFYWDAAWSKDPPDWLGRENPDWPGNYIVHYWDPAWQRVIMGHDRAYLDLIIKAGFDGVYLDLIDAYEYYEDQAG